MYFDAYGKSTNDYLNAVWSHIMEYTSSGRRMFARPISNDPGSHPWGLARIEYTWAKDGKSGTHIMYCEPSAVDALLAYWSRDGWEYKRA